MMTIPRGFFDYAYGISSPPFSSFVFPLLTVKFEEDLEKIFRSVGETESARNGKKIEAIV